jgi:hypothetical protein
MGCHVAANWCWGDHFQRLNQGVRETREPGLEVRLSLGYRFDETYSGGTSFSAGGHSQMP